MYAFISFELPYNFNELSKVYHHHHHHYHHREKTVKFVCMTFPLERKNKITKEKKTKKEKKVKVRAEMEIAANKGVYREFTISVKT